MRTNVDYVREKALEVVDRSTARGEVVDPDAVLGVLLELLYALDAEPRASDRGWQGTLEVQT